jgi:hypothetical protein
MAIVHPEGAHLGCIGINVSDFDPAVHTPWKEPDAVPDAPPPALDAPDTAAAKPPKRGSKP